jgi:hypothetical protein
MSFSQLEQLENIWKNETHKGDCLAQTSSFKEAFPHYMQAMMVSELLLENMATAGQHSLPVTEMYFAACQNIANTYWKMQDTKNAADYFLYCTYKMKQIAELSGVGNSVKQTAGIYWQKAVQLYGEFSTKTGVPMPPDMDKDVTYFQLRKLKSLFSLRKENMN